MEQKKKNLLEMRKLGFSQKTLSLLNESQISMILEKIKKKEAKEDVVQTTTKKTVSPGKEVSPEDLKGATKVTSTDKGTEVEIATVNEITVVETVSATGKIQPEIEVKISSEVSGEIIALPVKEGQVVKKGDLLVKIKKNIFNVT